MDKDTAVVDHKHMPCRQARSALYRTFAKRKSRVLLFPSEWAQLARSVPADEYPRIVALEEWSEWGVGIFVNLNP